jgi:hypothetical protein
MFSARYRLVSYGVVSKKLPILVGKNEVTSVTDFD